MKTALITGASGGIGSAIVKKFLNGGFFVVAMYNSGDERIKNFKNSLSEEQKEMLFCIKCDLKKSEELNRVVSNLERDFKRIDVLVNNAGLDQFKLLTETDEKEWDDIFSVNVKSAFVLSKFAVKLMHEREFGSIVNVSSVWGEVGASMETAYSASKAALIGLTKALAKEVAPSGITVNCVCPGVVDTPMNYRLSEVEKEEVLSRIPLGREGSPEEVADLVFFLSSEKARYITGETVNVGGGFAL